MKVLAGLGNPSARFANQRHNIGFLAIDRLAQVHGIAVHRSRDNALVGEGEIAGEPVLLVKPQTFMNRSGQVIGPIVRRMDLDLTDLLIIYDDLDLPLGRLRLREKGSAGGHNGLRSIIQALATSEFPRLRIGIGRPETAAVSAIDYVLTTFPREEREELDAVLGHVVDAVSCFIREGIQQAMSLYNR